MIPAASERGHTPAPWSVAENTRNRVFIMDANDDPVAQVFGETVGEGVEIASRIVALTRRCADLEAALGVFLDLCPRVSDDDWAAPALADACRDARAALAKGKA